MNKIISTKERVFISLVGPSGCGKSQLIFDWLNIGTFQPEFDKIFYFYQHYQPMYGTFENNHIEFIQGVDFDMIESLPNDGTNYLLIFDDSCEEISRSRQFVKIATAGRHRGLNAIYIKHNLFHKSPIGRDAELQNTHIALFKSPRDVLQVSKFGQQLGLGSQFTEWYNDATSKPFGHLLIDLSPRTVDKLRFCTQSGSIPTKFYLPKSQARITVLDDEHTKSIYSQTLSKLFPKTQKDVSHILSKGIHPISKRMYSKSLARTASGHYKDKGTKIQVSNKKTSRKKNKSTRKKNHSRINKRTRTR